MISEYEVMREYELVLIFDPEESKEKKAVLEKLKDWMKGKGRVIEENEWGRRKLAYPLKSKEGRKLQEGEYFQIDFEAEAEAVAKIEKKLKLEEKVIRYLVIRKQPMKGGEKRSGKKFE